MRNALVRPAIAWQDLRRLAPWERATEILLPVLLVALELTALVDGQAWLALAASAYFYLAGLRVVHDVFHKNLGLPRWGNTAVLSVLSALMLCSLHAVRSTHLRHHQAPLGPEDVEGHTARGSAWEAIFAGVLFPLRLHSAAWRGGDRTLRSWIVIELGVVAILLAVASQAPHGLLASHVLLMAVAQSLTGFFAVWTVHHDTVPPMQPGRTVRSRLKSALALDMFFHLEHHLYPRVPTRRLPELARRLDTVRPELNRDRVY